MALTTRLIAVLALFSSLAALGADVERSASLSATQGEYAVVAPIFTGAGGSTSYLRLVNSSGIESGAPFTATTYTIKVVGSPSGTVYGTAAIEVAANASPQYSIDEILSLAGVSGLSGGDTAYALYIQNPNLGTGFMHVIYNSVSGFFENASTCQAYVSADTEVKYLFNVHTSLLPAYPSQIYLHNYANKSVVYRVTVRDSKTGTSVGSTDITMAANSTTSMSFKSFEQAIGWTPTGNQLHANMTFEAIGESVAPVLVSQFITNTVVQGTSVNMSAICQINEISPGTGGGQTFALSVSKAGTGGGSVYSSPGGLSCGFDCNYAFNSGTNVTLTASSETGSTFTGWSGACTGTGITCNLTMSAVRSVTATFAGNSDSGSGSSTGGSGSGTTSGSTNYALTVTKAGTGTGNVTSSPLGIDCGSLCQSRSFEFKAGLQVTLTATATGGATFQGWGGACSGTGLCNVTMDAVRSVTASFGPVTNSLTVSVSGNGNVTSSPAGINCGAFGSACTSGFTTGTSVSLQALAQPGSTVQGFLGWTGCTSTGGNNGSLCNVDINGVQNVTARFQN